MSALPPVASGRRLRGIAVVAALSLGQAAAAAAAAFATRDVFAALKAPDMVPPVTALALIALSGLAIAILRVRERVNAERVGQDYASALRVALFEHISRLPPRALANHRAGGLALRFVGDLSAVRGWVSLGLARLVSAGIVLPLAVAAVFLLEPRLGLAALVPVAGGLAVMAVAGSLFGPVHRRLRARRSNLAADMSERLHHAPELRLMGRLPRERRALLTRTERMIEAALARAHAAALMRAVPDAAGGVAAAAVLFTAFRWGVPTAEAAGALAAVGLMLQPMRDLAGVWDHHRAWRAARAKCLVLLGKPAVRRRRRPLPENDAPPRLGFSDVRAGALRGVTAMARPGERIAIIGPNGAGKSTLLALAAGLEAPDAGRIRLDGQRPTDLTARDRRRLVAFSGARSPLLAGSLRRALTLGTARRPCDTALMLTAHVFGLGPVIERLGGLDGRVAEGGRNLSAGEARRLMLARAALSGARLLLLDEPDEALDASGPTLLRHLLARQKATALVVTHDPAVARAMDTVWLVADGRIVEAGPAAQMMGAGGAGSRLFAPRQVA